MTPNDLTPFTIKLEPFLGTSIEACSLSALDVANKLNVWVEFEFNSIVCRMPPNGSVMEMVDSFRTTKTRRAMG